EPRSCRKSIRVNLLLLSSNDLNFANELRDSIGGERVGGEPVGPGSFLFMRANCFAPTRDQRPRGFFISLPDFRRPCPATHPGHAYVRKHAVKLRLAEQR